jgi:hypothetical protein
MHSKAVVLLAFAGSSFALAQDVPLPIADPTSESMPLVAPRPTPAYTPLTPRESFQYGFNRVFSPGKLLLFGVEAAMDQEREKPDNWGQGMQSYGDRYADRFGRALVRENIAFGVRAVTGEYPRYELSHESGIWKRSKHAIISTFVVRGRDGRLMPAYSRIISDYATPIIAEQWNPQPYHATQALSAGTAGIGIAIASNLGAEFWPDIRRKFLRH